MAIIRIDITTEREYYHGMFADEGAACKAVDEYMDRNDISVCTMASKDDMLAVNAELAEVFDDPANYDNFAEWHEIESEVQREVCKLIVNGDAHGDTLLKIAELLQNENLIDLNEIWEN